MKLTQAFEGIRAPSVKKYAPKEISLVNPELIIGLELETENCQASAEVYAKELNKFNMTVTQDGSLRGVAYEFLTKPMRSDSAVSALTDYFNLTKFTDANYSDRCSIHVHVNCTDMELEQLSSLALLYTVVEEILFEFVGHNRDSNIYCIPWNQCRQHLNLIQTFLSTPSTVLKRWNKYTALNLIPLCSYGTVEFRQMHGTADMGKIVQWINIIGALFKKAKTTELKDLISEIKSLNSNSQYEVFFKDILADTLPYNEVYREKMEAGVILAKFSLINRKEPIKSKAIDLFDVVAPRRTAAEGRAQRTNVPVPAWPPQVQANADIGVAALIGAGVQAYGEVVNIENTPF